MRERFERFMRGRYGVDHFSHFIVVCALVIMLLQIIFPYNYAKAFLNVLAIAMLAYAYFRIFSRNHYKRYEENMRYMMCFFPLIGVVIVYEVPGTGG